jgi:multidrug transporter EmrE-like cation transporter
MIYLILAILCSASIAIIFKFSENKNMNRYVITTFNYVIASFISFISMILNRGIFKNIEGNFFYEFKEVIIDNNNSTFSSQGSIIWALLLGFSAGVFFFLSFFLYQKCIKENGVSISGAFGKLGILVPVIMSIVLWREIPLFLQIIGMMIAFFSIILINFPQKGEKVKINYLLILLFLIGGTAEFSNKIFQKYALIEYKELFLFSVFFSAFIISFYFMIKKSNSIRKKDVFIGFLVGIPNLFSSYFLILALKDINTSIAYSTYTSGSIFIIYLFGIFVFNEKLKKNETIAILTIILALILMNL